LNPPALSSFMKMVEAQGYGCESVRGQGSLKPECTDNHAYTQRLPGIRPVTASPLAIDVAKSAASPAATISE
jgi:hypothetical protein